MRFHPTSLRDAWLIELQPVRDDRGFFARTFCVEEFAAHGLETDFPQHSTSFSARKGTVRGMHYQCPPHSEAKLVRCVVGEIWDVIIDIRPGSTTYGHWQGFELSGANGRELYVPRGFAHGFQTLSDDVTINYLISEPYVSEAARGLRYNDPRFAIPWPIPTTEIAIKDTLWPDFLDFGY